MSTRKLFHVLCGVVILGVLATTSTGAMLNGRRTTYFTFNKAVELPGVSLSAGTYVFELPDPDHSWDIVRVMSRDRKQVYLTAFTKLIERPANRRLEAAIVFGEASAANPPRIKAWYPQDDRTGRQFIY